ncbi:MAG: HlyD family efflux transporter periplasmic adaptor subunit [SAR324 cluster bacterium]|nr:HlyD family efflux transporter periplasmic adaptor subunit [SAR324 cluster bacterium]MBF0351972.1 HlyD family efflux transporter periplasmic adaptor subunit [SAR324 cluster bacterium]
MRLVSLIKKIIRFSLPPLILAAGVVLMLFLVKSRPVAKKEIPEFKGHLVQTRTMHPTQHQIEIKGHGVVKASQQMILTPQITGTIQWINEKLDKGKFFRKGEILISLNPLNNANLELTVLKAPFNGTVQSSNLTIGQYITPGTPLATLVNSDTAEVVMDLPLSLLKWIPQQTPPNQINAISMISMKTGTDTETWRAMARRYLMGVTNQGMMMQIILEVQDPFRLSDTQALVPLFLGAFVDVTIPGQTLENVYPVPIAALHGSDTVWLVKEGLLFVQPVQVIFKNMEFAFVKSGIMPGDELITSPLKGASSGLKVRMERVDSARTNISPQTAGVSL